MKTKMLGILTVSAALLGTALSTTGVAQERGRGFDGQRPDMRGQMRGPGRGGAMRGGPRGAGQLAQPEHFIERLDTNADGQVSAAEFTEERLQHIDDMFEHRDTNGDGLISLEEHDAPRAGPGQRGQMRADRHERVRAARPELDRDAVTACVRETIADYEPRFDGQVEEVFADLDTNSDNMLSLTEVTAALEARAQAQFGRIDSDSNGFITEAEVTTHVEAQREAALAVRDCVKDMRDAAN
jgi:hypothetical protein